MWAIILLKALHNLNDEVVPATFLGKDSIGKMIERELKELEINTEFILNDLDFTCSSVVLYDVSGRRKIYCDLKDIQEKSVSIKFNYGRSKIFSWSCCL